MNRATMVANILRAWKAASPEDEAEGRAWYANAHGLAASLDFRNPRRAAGMLAALSPRMSWERTVALVARAYGAGVATGATGSMCGQANRILAGEAPEAVLGGPKVRAFYFLIAAPDDAHEVCVDRHATTVARGRRGAYDLRQKGRYEQIAGAFREAAAKLGELPSVVQAVTWVAERPANGKRRPGKDYEQAELFPAGEGE